MKIVMAMSGGVDSSTSAALLVKEGHELIGMHLHIWQDPVMIPPEEKGKFPQKQCCTVEALEQARRTCQRLNIPFYVVDAVEPFKKQIVDYFIETYAQGRTPNPCVECNRQIRFGLLLEHAQKLGATHLATGHYVRIHRSGGTLQLFRAKDHWKDQSYFLYTLTQEKLQHALFPMGEYTKETVRTMARKFGLKEVHWVPESQNICFFPDKKYQDFLKRHLPKEAIAPGNVVTRQGKKVGEHEGIAFSTIGQRHGLKLGGQKEPLYVVAIDPKKNAIVVGPRQDLLQREVTIEGSNFIAGEPPETPCEVTVKLRHPGTLEPAVLMWVKNGQAKIEFKKPVASVARGQSMVAYQGDMVVGGGVVI